MIPPLKQEVRKRRRQDTGRAYSCLDNSLCLCHNSIWCRIWEANDDRLEGDQRRSRKGEDGDDESEEYELHVDVEYMIICDDRS